jgi:RecG-like helicase
MTTFKLARGRSARSGTAIAPGDSQPGDSQPGDSQPGDDRGRDGPSRTKLADARAQAVIAAAGLIRRTDTITIGSSPCYQCELCDDSGQIDLLFLGHENIPGLTAGRHCTVHGRVGRYHGTLAMWNPRYQLRPADLIEWDECTDLS